MRPEFGRRLYSIGIAAALLSALVSSPAAPQIIHGVIAHAQHVSLPQCTVVAKDAWNFNDQISCTGPCLAYNNKGTVGTQQMSCGYSGGPACPTDMSAGGPDRNGSAYIFSGSTWVPVGLDTSDRTHQDYSIANELSVSFHFKARRVPDKSFGWFASPVVKKVGEFFSGADNLGSHAERICMNVDALNDLGGPDTGAVDCGATVSGTNNGLGATTGTLSTPKDEWIHVALVFNGEANPADNNGTYAVYLDGSLVNSEAGIDGTIANTPAKWTIGVGGSVFQFTDYEIDNLQIDDSAWSAARVLQADCNVPD